MDDEKHNFIFLFIHFSQDEIAEIIRGDPTIMRFADNKMEGIELLPHENAADVLYNERFDQLRANLRKVAYFLKHFRTASGNKKMTLREALSAKSLIHLSKMAVLLTQQYKTPFSLTMLKTLLGKKC